MQVVSDGVRWYQVASTPCCHLAFHLMHAQYCSRTFFPRCLSCYQPHHLVHNANLVSRCLVTATTTVTKCVAGKKFVPAVPTGTAAPAKCKASHDGRDNYMGQGGSPSYVGDQETVGGRLCRNCVSCEAYCAFSYNVNGCKAGCSDSKFPGVGLNARLFAYECKQVREGRTCVKYARNYCLNWTPAPTPRPAKCEACVNGKFNAANDASQTCTAHKTCSANGVKIAGDATKDATCNPGMRVYMCIYI